MRTVQIDVAESRGPSIDASLVSSMAAATLAVATVELVLLRLVSRTAIHIPGAATLEGPLALVDVVGRYAVVAGGVLVAVTALLVVVRLADAGRMVTAAAVGSTLLAAVAARIGWIGDGPFAVITLVSVAVLTVGVLGGGGGRLSVPVGCFSAAFVAAGIHAALQGLSGVGDMSPTSTIGLLLAAEMVLVVAAVALLVIVVDLRARDVAGGLIVGAVVWSALAASSATTKVLVLWSVGTPGYLPAGVYALAAAAAATALIAAVRSDGELAVALGLLVVGGIGLHNSYQTTLVVTGLALLASRTRTSEGCTSDLVEDRP